MKVWRRYGRFRLYVMRGEQKIGWYDPNTGESAIEVPSETVAFWNTVRLECARLHAVGTLDSPHLVYGPSVPVAPARPGLREPALVRQRPPEPDLALNLPGSAAKARAAELRAEHPWATIFARLSRRRNEALDYAYGAGGERKIGRKLTRWAARQGWHVLHAVPVGNKGSDIDHVLIGPFGVVTLNTKRTRGKVWVAEHAMMINGHKVDYLRNSRHEASRARTLLTRSHGQDVPVTGAIVFVGATGFTLRGGGPPDLTVLRNAAALRGWLRSRPTILTPDQIATLYDLARKPSTWQY